MRSDPRAGAEGIPRAACECLCLFPTIVTSALSAASRGRSGGGGGGTSAWSPVSLGDAYLSRVSLGGGSSSSRETRGRCGFAVEPSDRQSLSPSRGGVRVKYLSWNGPVCHSSRSS